MASFLASVYPSSTHVEEHCQFVALAEALSKTSHFALKALSWSAADAAAGLASSAGPHDAHQLANTGAHLYTVATASITGGKHDARAPRVHLSFLCRDVAGTGLTALRMTHSCLDVASSWQEP